MAMTIEQDAEMYVRRCAKTLVDAFRRDTGGMVGASEQLLLSAEEHIIGVANHLEAAADWIRDGKQGGN